MAPSTFVLDQGKEPTMSNVLKSLNVIQQKVVELEEKRKVAYLECRSVSRYPVMEGFKKSLRN